MEGLGILSSIINFDRIIKISAQIQDKVATIIAQNGAEKLSINYSNPIPGPTVMDEQTLSINVVIWGQDVTDSIVNDGSGVNVINKITCDRLGITKWDTCPSWLRMADTSTVRPLGLIRQLDVIVGGHSFQILAVVLHLDATGAYLLLLGRPWRKTANIKQNWNKDILTFRKGQSKFRVSTQEKISTSRQCLPVHAKALNMMEGLDEAEEDQYFEDNPKIIPLFEVNIIQTLTSYMGEEDKEEKIHVDEKTLKELRLQQEATERDMQVSQRVQASALEKLNLADTNVESKIILIAIEMESTDNAKMTNLLRQYKDVFAWSFDVKPVQQCRY